MSVDASGIATTLARIREIAAMAAPAATSSSGAATTATTAATVGTATESDFASALSSARAATGSTATTSASSVTGAQLDAWMAQKNPGSPLIGLGDVFVREGRANGIDPRALVSIARAESSLGSDAGARARHNAFGWGPARTFATWEDNIATVARGLRSGYLDQGLTTLAQIQRRYAPVGTANDPANLNSNWLRNTTLLYGELGGDPSGSVAIS